LGAARAVHGREIAACPDICRAHAPHLRHASGSALAEPAGTGRGICRNGPHRARGRRGVTVLRGPPDAAKRQETIDQGTPVMLGPGDSVFIAGGTAASPRNPGEEPANVLVAEIGSAEDNRQAPAAPVPVKGIAAQSLASAVATTVPAAPVVIELGRLTLAPGAKISSESRPGVVGPQAGPELTAVESGTFGLKVSTGEVELFPQGRSTLGTERKGRGQMAPLLTETALRPRDAMLGQSGASDMMWNAGKVPAAAILIRFLPVKKQP